MRVSFRLCALAAIAGLSACGGGGSADTATGYPLDSAMSAYFQARHSYTLTASSGSDHYVYRRGWLPAGMQTFQGVSAFAAVQTAVLTDNGSAVSNDTQTKFFLIGPYRRVGGIDTDNGEIFVESDQHDLPALASIGDSGKLDTGIAYTDATLSKAQATYVETWDLTAVTADEAMLCFELAFTVAQYNSTSNSSFCYIMDQRGNVTAIQESVDLGGQQLTFK